MKPRLVIFSSGTKEGGGSGFENLVLKSRDGILNADICAVVSNHERGAVRERADRLGIPFIFFSPKPSEDNSNNYKQIVKDLEADFIALSGWLKLVSGLDPSKTINIHPGPLPRFGGKGMYGHFVHEAVIEAFKKGEVKETEINMHFVTPIYDEGPVFFKLHIPISPDDDALSLSKKVNLLEHEWQPKITNLVVNKEISFDAKQRKLFLPTNYEIDHFVKLT